MNLSCLPRWGVASVAMLGVTASLAAPVTVSVRGDQYSISTVVASEYNSPELITGQVWWEDSDLARDFASALGGQSGQPNNLPLAGGWIYGPLFAYNGLYGDLTYMGSVNYIAWTYQESLGDVTVKAPVSFDNHYYAVATRVVDPGIVPEPSTLALAGLAAVALVGSRRRRVGPCT